MGFASLGEEAGSASSTTAPEAPSSSVSQASSTATSATTAASAEGVAGARVTSKSDPKRWKYRNNLRATLGAVKGSHTDSDLERIAVERAAAKLLRTPDKAAALIAKLPMEQRRTVALAWAMTELEEEFVKADADRDGKLNYKEFKQWIYNTIEKGNAKDQNTEPSRKQLNAVAINALVPFIGFGAVDNGLLVIYGDVIDGTLGLMFSMSMLACAALGNAISNIFGMIGHGTIQKMSDKLGLPDPNLTLVQRKHPNVHFWSTFGSTVGVFTGCLLGMAPLLLMDQTKKEADRAAEKAAHTAEMTLERATP